MGIGQILGIVDNLPFPASRVGSLTPSGSITAAPNTIASSGDFAVSFGATSVSSGSGNAWTQPSGAPALVKWKILETGDMATGITLSGVGAGGKVVIWHGPTSMEMRSSGSYVDPDSEVTLTGYTKNTAYTGQFAFSRFTSGGGGSVTVSGLSAMSVVSSYTNGGFDAQIEDWLYGTKPEYPDGTSFAASLGGGTGFSAAAYVFELLR
jgi:hypothetical protein